MSDAALTPRPLAPLVCFGEILLRLSAPDSERLLQTPRLAVHVGGAEANVAVSLAHMGHPTVMASVLPDNALGRACQGELRRQGVGTEGIRLVPGRLGVYFFTAGAGHRPSEVLYDREASAFALAAPDLIDWDALLQGAGWLHLSGIVAAVSPRAAQAARVAVRKARSHGLSVSFDCNYRATLWEGRESEARPILREIVSEADLLFASERDIALILGEDFSATPSSERFRRAAGAMLATCPLLKQVATTIRVEHSVDHHDLSGMSCSRAEACTSRTYSIGRIVDRIGSGDAFAAGLLHAIMTGFAQPAALDFAVAAACLKHSIPGDFNLVSHDDVLRVVHERGFSVRR
jgi:2-dehydro-3-deoxygluconokinase